MEDNVSEDSEVKSEDDERLNLEVKPDLMIKEELEDDGEDDEDVGNEMALLNFEVIMEGEWKTTFNFFNKVLNFNL